MSHRPIIQEPAQGIIDAFCHRNRRLARPDGAFDRCRTVSGDLLSDLADAGIEAVAVRMSCCQKWMPDAHPKWLALAGSYWTHYAVRIGDLLVDVSARQFDPDSAFPAIVPLEDAKGTWMEVEDWDMENGLPLTPATGRSP